MDIVKFATQARDFVKTADEAGRKRLLDDLRDLSYSIESPQDTAQRITYLHLQPVIVRIGCDIGLFSLLTKSTTPLTVEGLAKTTGVAPTLLARILRYLASVGVIQETDKDTFTKSNLTETFTMPGFIGGLYHNLDTLGPVFQILPSFLAENGYQDLSTPMHTPLQKAWNTDLPAFIWVQTKPVNLAHFNQFMVGGRVGMPTWLDVYPWQDLIKGLNPEQPLFVDVGGGLGAQCIALRDKVPNLHNKIILQDQAAVIQHSIKHPGVDAMAQDFFQPQAVKGARIYYMRNIIHDYPDEKCIDILRHTIAALAPGSVILLDDMVIPTSGAHWQATQLDLTMMSALGSRERTLEQWHDLMEKAGLKINHIYTYTSSLQDSIIECVPI